MFRIWANRVLKDFIIKGYVMDDARPVSYTHLDVYKRQPWNTVGTGDSSSSATAGYFPPGYISAR